MNRSFLLAGAFAAAMGWSSAAQADDPREFLRNAQQADNSEIMLGRMAAQQARSPAVRDFGSRLVSDHRQARDEVRELGRRFGLRPNRDIAPEAQDERERLADLRGREFDREFIRYMVDDHRKDMREFRDEARENHGPVSELAARQLPTLREHLRMAIALERSDGRSLEGGPDMARDRGYDRYRDDGRQYGNDIPPNRGNNQYGSRDDRDRDWQR